MIDFVKTQGTGNDFVLFEDFDHEWDVSPDAVRALCDRHFGIGADGLIRITRSVLGGSTFFMDYRNADGSTVEMCGNGIRTVGKWLGDRGHADDMVSVDTRSGVKELKMHRGANGFVETVTVDMGPPLGEVSREVISTDVGEFASVLVSMGNPHAVVFVGDVDSTPVDQYGSIIERLPRFPRGTNVEFVDRRNDVLRQRTWERGVGETLACGTGACAVAVAGRELMYNGNDVTIELRGGRLELNWSPGQSVLMTGPAVEVFAGSFDEDRFGVVRAG